MQFIWESVRFYGHSICDHVVAVIAVQRRSIYSCDDSSGRRGCPSSRTSFHLEQSTVQQLDISDFTNQCTYGGPKNYECTMLMQQFNVNIMVSLKCPQKFIGLKIENMQSLCLYAAVKHSL